MADVPSWATEAGENLRGDPWPSGFAGRPLSDGQGLAGWKQVIHLYWISEFERWVEGAKNAPDIPEPSSQTDRSLNRWSSAIEQQLSGCG